MYLVTMEYVLLAHDWEITITPECVKTINSNTILGYKCSNLSSEVNGNNIFFPILNLLISY